jgi:hypothetical protein
VLLLDDKKHSEQLVVTVLCKVVSCDVGHRWRMMLRCCGMQAGHHTQDHGILVYAGARCGRAEGKESVRNVEAARAGNRYYSAEGACRCVSAPLTWCCHATGPRNVQNSRGCMRLAICQSD